METNLKSNRHLILKHNEDGNIAIIKCVRGKAQITEQVELALKEHYVADTLQIVDSYTIYDDTESQEFQVYIYLDGDDFYSQFTLEFITVY